MAAGMLFHEGSVLIVIANAMRLLRRQAPSRQDASSAAAGEPALITARD